MRNVTISIKIEVPDWATHAAVDEWGDIVALSATRNGEEIGIGKDDDDGSWWGGMARRARVANWAKTLTMVKGGE